MTNSTASLDVAITRRFAFAPSRAVLDPMGIMPRGGKPGNHLRLFGSAHGVVQALEQEGEPHAGSQAQHEGESEISRNIRFDRVSRNAGDVYDTEVVGFKSGRNPGLFHLLHQSFIELAVGFEVALQEAVLDGALVEFVCLLLLLFERVVQHALALHGGHVLSTDLARDLLGFRKDLACRFP